MKCSILRTPLQSYHCRIAFLRQILVDWVVLDGLDVDAAWVHHVSLADVETGQAYNDSNILRFTFSL